jgi:hypothetical protein
MKPRRIDHKTKQGLQENTDKTVTQFLKSYHNFLETRKRNHDKFLQFQQSNRHYLQFDPTPQELDSLPASKTIKASTPS